MPGPGGCVIGREAGPSPEDPENGKLKSLDGRAGAAHRGLWQLEEGHGLPALPIWELSKPQAEPCTSQFFLGLSLPSVKQGYRFFRTRPGEGCGRFFRPA